MNDTGDSCSVDHPETLARTAVERSNLYGFLATGFREEPTIGLIRFLRDPAFRDALAGAGVILDAHILDTPEEKLVEDLAEEFTAFFLGPDSHISPHESVQCTDGGGSLWGPETVAVKRYIEAAGFTYDEHFHDIPDHISVELEFMAHLCREEAQAWEAGVTDRAANSLAFQRDFMEQHLGAWAGRFCTLLVERAELAFYREIAGLTADFLNAERGEIAKRLERMCK